MRPNTISINQTTLFPLDYLKELKTYAASEAENRGAVYTRSEVVEFILDLAEYTSSNPLYRYRILEPSFGNGDFLIPVIERLLASYKKNAHRNTNIVNDLTDSIRAVEINHKSFITVQNKVNTLFREHDVPYEQSQKLISSWLIEGDFLLVDLPFTFTHIVGNPPYVRQELVPNILMNEYRLRYSTIYDRADLYIPFIERCLLSLKPSGSLAFICSDRWMKNKYGKKLREMIARKYHLAMYVDMVNTSSFSSNVIAYPAITVMRKTSSRITRIAHRPEITRSTLATLAREMNSKTIPIGSNVSEAAVVENGSEPWIFQAFDKLSIVRRLEKEFPLLEETGCKVGIGVATGADKVYIGPFDSLDVEADRKLPLVTTKDIENGRVNWKGLGVINPFHKDGGLVDLSKYPKLARLLEKHSQIIKSRNCAQKNPANWFRTIDRIYPEIAERHKLLIPDIKDNAHIVYEEGGLYPHHNLYFITSDKWDLKVLQGVLQSGIAKLFVSTYSTEMRGGYLRFQAQYLRRIRLPNWEQVSDQTKQVMTDAVNKNDIETCIRETCSLYKLTPAEWRVIDHDNQERKNNGD